MPSVEERFWSKVDKTETCWLWTAGTTGTGYGLFSRPRTAGKRANTTAHRWAYETMVGPLPEGMVPDHLCGIKLCVNPDHLEAVSQAENVRRWSRTITRCPRGHEYTDENTVVATNRLGNPFRMCRTCSNARRKALHQRSKV